MRKVQRETKPYVDGDTQVFHNHLDRVENIYPFNETLTAWIQRLNEKLRVKCVFLMNSKFRQHLREHASTFFEWYAGELKCLDSTGVLNFPKTRNLDVPKCSSTKDLDRFKLFYQ